MNGVSGLLSDNPMPLSNLPRDTSITLFDLSRSFSRTLPPMPHFRLAKLPALVMLTPPMEVPLHNVWLVLFDVSVLFVALEDAFVTVVLFVNVRPRP